ncbi:MAG: hypothetical protein J6X49_04415, partial [Victivallales bacterium]|nr:hypothetical protein [Victivallales bacterium]
MSTLAWIIVNIALLSSAVVSVKLAKDLPKELKNEQKQLIEKTAPEQKKPKDGKETAKDGKQAKPQKQQAAPEQTPPPQIRLGAVDDIWKKSLFNPDRTEMTETDTPQSESVEPINNTELELSAILQLGEKSVAVIKQKQQQRGRGGRQQGGFQGRPGMPQFGGNMPGGGRFGGNMPGGNMPGGGRFGGYMPGMPPWMQQQQQQQQQP